MKLHMHSDLHLEFCSFVPPPNDADVVIFAGDIHTHGRGVKWADGYEVLIAADGGKYVVALWLYENGALDRFDRVH
jgi:hypothetical protein